MARTPEQLIQDRAQASIAAAFAALELDRIKSTISDMPELSALSYLLDLAGREAKKLSSELAER